jgi:hypothetical protein
VIVEVKNVTWNMVSKLPLANENLEANRGQYFVVKLKSVTLLIPS